MKKPTKKLPDWIIVSASDPKLKEAIEKKLTSEMEDRGMGSMLEEDPAWEENSIQCPNCEREAKKHQRQLVRKNHIVTLNWHDCEHCNWKGEMSETEHPLKP